MLEWLRPAIQTCSQQIPERHWIILPTELAQSETADLAVQLFWGAKAVPSENTFLITSDRLLIVTNPSNPLQSLTLAEIRSIFTGKISRWDEIATDLPANDIHVWIYPQNTSFMANFSEWSSISPQSLTSLAFLSSHPLELRETVANDPLAIGILSSRWLGDQVKVVELPQESNYPDFPVLASIRSMDEYIQEWLFCIQNRLKS